MTTSLKSDPKSPITPSEARPQTGWQLRRAWRSLRRLFANPDDTRAVFEIIEALPGRSAERSFRRFAASKTGQRILNERRNLLATLSNRDALLALPAGTLGRTYGEFMTEEEISADGLVDASGDERDRYDDANALLFSERLRDMHDLWHVVTGHGRDLRGEAGLLAFTFVQLRTPGIGLIVLMAYIESDAESRRVIREGVQRGRRAAWLPEADWEALLSQPLAQVRESLGITDLPDYEPEFSAAAPAGARAA